MRITLIGFLVLVMGAAVKAHIHFIRLALLAAMGLMGMWMMHKLAQDWQKISSSNRPAKPASAAMAAGKLLGIWKRSIPDAHLDEFVEESLDDFYKFDDILRQDRSTCARKMICQIAATPQNQLNRVETNLLKMLSPSEHFGDDAAKNIFRKAMNFGRSKKDVKACHQEYKKCRFNTRQMFKLFTSFM
ncbi:uncharacterized protein LOC112691773 isoform X2 [Sipha flava]|uniref:Uncharacterized protein LOC112691773 isoform X2 n=1 Tax=Sipha flava TaxID=143950 RepID=A0A8B8GG56_9HEMI|nr:uncharacterized protein LOC112691773 isoform X2 [Sipha flava]